MKILKKIGIILGIIILLLIALFFAVTGPVDETPYFESGYFKKSCAEADSLKNNFTPAKGLLLAGFSKVSITPALNSAADNIGWHNQNISAHKYNKFVLYFQGCGFHKNTVVNSG